MPAVSVALLASVNTVNTIRPVRGWCGECMVYTDHAGGLGTSSKVKLFEVSVLVCKVPTFVFRANVT